MSGFVGDRGPDIFRPSVKTARFGLTKHVFKLCKSRIFDVLRINRAGQLNSADHLSDIAPKSSLERLPRVNWQEIGDLAEYRDERGGVSDLNTHASCRKYSLLFGRFGIHFSISVAGLDNRNVARASGAGASASGASTIISQPETSAA